jgi:hypothetical protein
MGILDKYAREPLNEKRTKSIGTRIEQSLYDDFNELCDRLGLTAGEAVRYVVMEVVAKDKEEKAKLGKQKLTESRDEIATTSEAPTLTNHSIAEFSTVIASEREEEQDNRGKAGSLKPWTVNDQIPCPICGTWSSRSNYKRSHAAKHGFTMGIDLILAHKEKADAMYKERTQGE